MARNKTPKIDIMALIDEAQRDAIDEMAETLRTQEVIMPSHTVKERKKKKRKSKPIKR